MRYQISEIKITADEYRDRESRNGLIKKKLLKKLVKLTAGKGKKGRVTLTEADISEIEILRESVDARKKPNVMAVFSVAFASEKELPVKTYEGDTGFDPRDIPAFSGNRKRPIVAGFGPCGMFAALVLAMAGAKPIVLERGKPVEDRMKDVERFWKEGILDPESNVQFGEGGAGTFSDGKLTTGVRDARIKWVLRQLVEGGADPEILYKNRPHIGTDRLRTIVPNIRKRIEALGGEIRFSTRLERIDQREGALKGIFVKSRDEEGPEEYIPADCMIIATGHSAEDTFRMLREEGLEMRPKPFSIGVRIEHLQEDIDREQYGDPKLAEVFGHSEYKLNHRCENGRGVYTFCMCPGGQVINASSSKGYGLTNGMSNRARDGKYANSALLVDVRVEDFQKEGDPLSGIAFQKKYEKMAWERGDAPGLPVTDYGSFRKKEDDKVRSCLPDFAAEGILEAMPHLGKKLKGFDSDDARMTAVESRSSSPVRIIRDDKLQSTVSGIIPAGEGPGYAGGIMSAAVDGIKAAQAVLDLE